MFVYMGKDNNNYYTNEECKTDEIIKGRLFLREPCICASLSFVYTRDPYEGKEMWFNDNYQVLWDNGKVILWDD